MDYKILDTGFVQLINLMGDDATVVDAARVSFARDVPLTLDLNEKDEKLIYYLMKNRHTSPFEHVAFTFLIKCPLFVRSQIMRHRTFSYNEISRRYTSEEIEFYIPDKLRKQSKDNKQASVKECVTHIVDGWCDADPDDYQGIPVAIYLNTITQQCLSTYTELLKYGVAREQARMILPQNLYTRFYMTGNLHNWFHFLDLRLHPHTQYETREVAKGVAYLIKNAVPVSFSAWEEYVKTI